MPTGYIGPCPQHELPSNYAYKDSEDEDKENIIIQA